VGPAAEVGAHVPARGPLDLVRVVAAVRQPKAHLLRRTQSAQPLLLAERPRQEPLPVLTFTIIIVVVVVVIVVVIFFTITFIVVIVTDNIFFSHQMLHVWNARTFEFWNSLDFSKARTTILVDVLGFDT
jgi:hypothetical protein